MSVIDVLIPIFERPEALAITLSGLAAQDNCDFRVIISDQSAEPMTNHPLVAAMRRVLEFHGVRTEHHHQVPPRGLAEQRDFLVGLSSASQLLLFDDDVCLEPWSLNRLSTALTALRCGFVGFAVQGLSYQRDKRPEEWHSFEEWSGIVQPERIRRGDQAWQRYQLHNAANPTHLAEQLSLTPWNWRAYKVAWIGGCVMYDRSALLDVGGFEFWPEVPVEHAGEDVLVQLRVMVQYGGAGLLPSGAVHLKLPTTVPNRDVECYDVVAP